MWFVGLNGSCLEGVVFKGRSFVEGCWSLDLRVRLFIYRYVRFLEGGFCVFILRFINVREGFVMYLLKECGDGLVMFDMGKG